MNRPAPQTKTSDILRRAQTARSMSVVVPVPYELARRDIHTDELVPVVFSPGRALCILQAAEIEDELVGRYREFVISYLCAHQPALLVPLVPVLLHRILPSVGVFVAHLAVTSSAASDAVRSAWGISGCVADISFEEAPTQCTARVYIGGSRSAGFTVAKHTSPPRRHLRTLRMFAHVDGHVLSGRFRFETLGWVSHGARAGVVEPAQCRRFPLSAACADISLTAGTCLESRYSSRAIRVLTHAQLAGYRNLANPGTALAVPRDSYSGRASSA